MQYEPHYSSTTSPRRINRMGFAPDPRIRETGMVQNTNQTQSYVPGNGYQPLTEYATNNIQGAQTVGSAITLSNAPGAIQQDELNTLDSALDPRLEALGNEPLSIRGEVENRLAVLRANQPAMQARAMSRRGANLTPAQRMAMERTNNSRLAAMTETSLDRAQAIDKQNELTRMSGLQDLYAAQSEEGGNSAINLYDLHQGNIQARNMAAAQKSAAKKQMGMQVAGMLAAFML
jgi:hypothetical protein